MSRLVSRSAPVALVAASLLFLLSAALRGTHPDEEEFRNAILTTMLHARALVDGVYPYWTSSLAFGLPHPLSPAPIFHPLVLLFALMPADVASFVLYVFHAVLGAGGCWWLVRTAGGGPWAAALGSATWALSAPSQNYLLTDFWPAEFVIWSLAPFLLLAALRVIEAPNGRQPWMSALGFGLTAGLMWANGHAGYVPVFFIPLAVMFAAHPRKAWRLWPALMLAVGIGALVAGPTLLQLIIEVGRFPRLPRVANPETIGLAHAWDLFLRPLSLGSPVQMYDAVLSRGTRVPFYGGPMFVLSLCGVFGLIQVPRYRRGIAFAFLSALGLLALPDLDGIRLLAATYLFRDSLVLFGIVLGATAWQALEGRRPRVAAVVAVLQVLVLFGASWPFVRKAAGSQNVAHAAIRDTPVTRSLRAMAEQYPGRWYLSPGADDLATRDRLFIDGLWRTTWAYRDLPIVNGSFKGVSVDPMYPSGILPYGQIRGNPATVSSAPLLTVLGISVVLAVPGEAVSSQLQEVNRITTYESGDLRVLRNPDVWPGAAFVSDGIVDDELSPLAGCREAGLLCRDFGPVLQAVQSVDVHLTRRHGTLHARFASDPTRARWLLLTEMFRPGWRATADNRYVPVTAALGGLIAVPVPAGASSVDLAFRPAGRIIATWLAWITIAVASGVLSVGTMLRRRTPRDYFYALLARYIGYHLPEQARIVELAPRSTLLREALGRSGLRILPQDESAADPADGKVIGWSELRRFEPDRIILNGTVHESPDIQAVLERVRNASVADTRLLIVYYNSLWRPLVALGRRLGLATTEPEHNWVSPSDVENLLRLSGYELISQSQHVLLPVYVPLVSTLVNRWLAPLPVVRWFALLNLAVARPSPRPSDGALSVSVIVPARNERGNIAEIIRRVPQMGPDDELIFVEGHSSDGTWEAIQAAVLQNPSRRIVALRQSGRGKGDAVRAGFDAARRDLLMILDADLTVPPEDLPKFYRVLTSGTGEFVNGSRLVYPMEREAMQFANILGNKFFALAFSFLLGQPMKDTLCGTKALSKTHYERIARNRLYFGDFDPFGDFDLLFGASKLGLRIVELPIRYRERTYGTTNIRRWSHGWLLLRMTLVAARRIKFI